MSDLLHRTLGETIQVETVLGDTAGPAMADPNQLENALLNLAVNARDAILDASPGGGRLVIETTNASIDGVQAAQCPDLEPGDYVVIATTDTGTGMSVETLSRAFEPFFTTKPTGQGTGLGLAQVHGFAKQSGGHVAIDSELGRGTTVRLFLPRLRQDAALPATPIANHDDVPSRNGETILIVEDEAGVRQFTGDALRELGYAVLEAEGGEQALALLEEHPEIALLMTDVVMAGMGGCELAERVQQERPELPVLLTSGYSRIPGGPDLGAGWELLGKPFTVSALAKKVGEILR
jgi:CheY-like chemotaxis protein